MTNRDMVKPRSNTETGSERSQTPNRTALPPMPAPEDSATPTTPEEPIDSPQPRPSAERPPPPDGEIGLATKR